jgi:hypothetical protein
MIILLAIVICLYGLALLFARDFMWDLTVMGNEMKGRASERTELWETQQVIGGVICLLLGAGLICMQVSRSSEEAAKVANATATATSLLTALDEAFGPHLAEWQKVEREVAYTVRPREVDIRASAIYYGRCSNNRFYLYVLGFNNLTRNYAYVPRSQPENCAPDGISVWDSELLGDDWYRVNAYGTPVAVTRVAPTLTPTAEVTPD